MGTFNDPCITIQIIWVAVLSLVLLRLMRGGNLFSPTLWLFDIAMEAMAHVYPCIDDL